MLSYSARLGLRWVFRGRAAPVTINQVSYFLAWNASTALTEASLALVTQRSHRRHSFFRIGTGPSGLGPCSCGTNKQHNLPSSQPAPPIGGAPAWEAAAQHGSNARFASFSARALTAAAGEVCPLPRVVRTNSWSKKPQVEELQAFLCAEGAHPLEMKIGSSRTPNCGQSASYESLSLDLLEIPYGPRNFTPQNQEPP